MRAILLFIISIQAAMATGNWTEFSRRKVSNGTGDFSKALSCRYSRTFTNDYQTRVMLHLDELNPNTESLRDIMMKDRHQPSIYTYSKERNVALCDQVDELKSIGWGNFETDNIVLSNGEVVKEIIEFRFKNGLLIKSEATYRIRN